MSESIIDRSALPSLIVSEVTVVAAITLNEKVAVADPRLGCHERAHYRAQVSCAGHIGSRRGAGVDGHRRRPAHERVNGWLVARAAESDLHGLPDLRRGAFHQIAADQSPEFDISVGAYKGCPVTAAE